MHAHLFTRLIVYYGFASYLPLICVFAYNLILKLPTTFCYTATQFIFFQYFFSCRILNKLNF